jgi:hypothetical protein
MRTKEKSFLKNLLFWVILIELLKRNKKNHKKFESIDFVFLNDKSEDFPCVQKKFQKLKKLKALLLKI